MPCEKCELLMELYKQVESSPRNYWVMTELFYFLHDGDVCNSSSIETEEKTGGFKTE